MTVSRCDRFQWSGFAASSLASVIFILCSVTLVGGCRLCADCDDDAYPAYGGAWQRTHRDSGRVGSIFDPGGSRASDLAERAQSDSPNVTNRSPNAADNESSESNRDSGSAEPDEERDPMDTDGLTPTPGQRERELQELEQQYRDLQLEEINRKGSPVNSAEWQ